MKVLQKTEIKKQWGIPASHTAGIRKALSHASERHDIIVMRSDESVNNNSYKWGLTAMKQLFLSVIFLFICPLLANATVYYINPSTGADANNGTSSSTPKQTINSVASLVQPGDTVNLMNGTYGNGQYFYSAVNGTSAAPITIQAYAGATPTISGTGEYNVYFDIQHNYYVINGLTFVDNASISESINMTGSYNTIENCTFAGSNLGSTTAFVFITNSSHDNVLNNTITNLGDDGAASGSPGMGSGDGIVLEASNYCLVQGNTVNGAGHSAIELQAYPTNLTVGSNYNQILNNTINQSNGGGGIYLLEESANNTVSGNSISNVGQMVGITQNKAGIDLSGAANNTISNNNIQNYGKSGDCDNDGIYISSYNNSGFNNTNCNNNLIENNTIGQGYGIPIYYREGTGDRSAGINVSNNTFTGNTVYLPYQEITCSDYIGSYDKAGYYYVYLGSYTDGPWPTFANGNTFLNNTWVDPNSVGGLIGYYYTGTSTGGFSVSVPSAESTYSGIFSGSVTTSAPSVSTASAAPAAPQNLTVQ